MIAEEVRSEINRLGVAEVSPGLVAVTIRLAEALDAIPVADAPTSQAILADKLTGAMTKLRALSPGDVKGDAVDDIAEQRKKRRAGTAEAEEESG